MQIDLADFAGERFVMVARALDPELDDTHITRLRAQGLAMPRVREAETKHAVLAMVAAGAGVAAMPRSARRCLSLSGVSVAGGRCHTMRVRSRSMTASGRLR
jgi:DNA-binding transcriptional LysR family regulator